MTDAASTLPDQSHRIEAYEALWVTTYLELDPDTENALVTVNEIIHDGVDQFEPAWEYECSCGEDFDTIDDAMTHLQDASQNTPE